MIFRMKDDATQKALESQSLDAMNQPNGFQPMCQRGACQACVVMLTQHDNQPHTRGFSRSVTGSEKSKL